MPYYAVGDYYGRGDYYRGDPFLGKLVRAVGGAVKGFVSGGPLGAVSGAVGAFTKPPAIAAPRQMVDIRGPFGTGVGFGPVVSGAAPPSMAFGGGGFGFRRRRMNPMNVKALRRASRRIDSFVRTARSALKHTQYVLVRRGNRTSRGVITRAEAARALRR